MVMVKQIWSIFIYYNMARPIGTKQINDPNEILDMFNVYFELVKSNPKKVQDYVGKDGNAVYRDKEKPLTMDGFYCWCYENGVKSIRNYFDNRGEFYNDFIEVCSHIKRKVKNDQIEGGMVGIYSQSITARLNGLTDKSEVVMKEQPLFPDVQTDNGN